MTGRTELMLTLILTFLAGFVVGGIFGIWWALS